MTETQTAQAPIATIAELCALPQLATITDANGNTFTQHSTSPTNNPNWIYWEATDGTKHHSENIALPATDETSER